MMEIDLTARLTAALRALDAAIDGNGGDLASARVAAREAIAISDAATGPWIEMCEDARSGRDVLLYYPLDGLADYHPRIVIGYWRRDAKTPAGGGWVFQNRAYRGYSEVYQPSHYQPLAAPGEAVRRSVASRRDAGAIAIKREMFRSTCTGAALDDICGLGPRAVDYAAFDAVTALAGGTGEHA